MQHFYPMFTGIKILLLTTSLPIGHRHNARVSTYPSAERENKMLEFFLKKIKKLGVFLIAWKADENYQQTWKEITEEGHIEHIITLFSCCVC